MIRTLDEPLKVDSIAATKSALTNANYALRIHQTLRIEQFDASPSLIQAAKHYM